MDGSQGELFGGTPLEPSAVRHFLANHPEFIRSDEGLLAELGLRVDGGNVVDFGPAALARVHAAHQREAEQRQLVEETARANFAAQAQIHGAVVDLLDTESHSDLALCVDALACARFGLSAAIIAVETEGRAPDGWRRLVEGQIDLILGGPRQLACMGFQPTALGLFGQAKDPVRSMAMVRMAIWQPAAPALLAFGSADPEGFTSDMGSELVAFLARVVERTAERWPRP
jgi:uncharacterized protein YigA (DUF484 family)